MKFIEPPLFWLIQTLRGVKLDTFGVKILSDLGFDLSYHSVGSHVLVPKHTLVSFQPNLPTNIFWESNSEASKEGLIPKRTLLLPIPTA